MSDDDGTLLPSIPGYRIVDRIGGGRASVVYRAVQLSMNRAVALKILLVDLASDTDRRRFGRERELLSTLSTHRNVVDAYDAGITPEGRPFIVMRLYQRSLAQEVEQAGPLRLLRAAQIVQDIADALDTAHKQGAIHRDVNPNNILLTEDGHAVLADFGIAALLDPATSTATFAYTPAYSAPEAVNENLYSVASDVYSLAATTVFLLTGVRPASGRDPLLGRGLPAGVRLVLATAMSAATTERPSSAGEFARSLTAAALEGNPARLDDLQAFAVPPSLNPFAAPAPDPGDWPDGPASTGDRGPASGSASEPGSGHGRAFWPGLAVAMIAVLLIAGAGIVKLRHHDNPAAPTSHVVAATTPTASPQISPQTSPQTSLQPSTAANPTGTCPTGRTSGLRITDPVDADPAAPVPHRTRIRIAGVVPAGCYLRVFLWAPEALVAYPSDPLVQDPATGEWVATMPTGRGKADNGKPFIYYAVLLNAKWNGRVELSLATRQDTGYSVPEWRSVFSARVFDTVKVTLHYG